MTNSKLSLGVALVALVIAIGGYFVKQEVQLAGTGSTYTEVLEFLGGIVYGNSVSTTTTATTYTLTANDIAPRGVLKDVILITPNTGDLTLTFPASSTMPHVLPTVGKMAKQCWYNASTTAGIDITFAAGTGIDLEVASSTSGGQQTAVLTVLANSSVCFTYIRKPATTAAFDISVLMTRFVDGD